MLVIQLYDARYYSDDTLVLWGVAARGNKPVCVYLEKIILHYYIRLPDVYGGLDVDWSDKKACETLIEISREIASNDEYVDIGVVGRTQMFDYRERPVYLLDVSTSTRTAGERLLSKLCKRLREYIYGNVALELETRETEIDPVLQVFVANGWPRSGVFEIDVSPEPEEDGRKTQVYRVCAENIKVCSSQSQQALALGAYFDIETYSHDPNAYPDAMNPADVIFAISLVFAYYTKLPEKRYILYVGSSNTVNIPDCVAICANTEIELITKFFDIICHHNPDFLSGYNIHDYDLRYICTRCALFGIKLPQLSRTGQLKQWEMFEDLRGPRGKRYPSIRMHGRIILDMYLYVLQFIPLTELSRQRLKDVAKKYLDEDDQKIDLDYKEMFAMFRDYIRDIATTGAPSQQGVSNMQKIAEYCMRDADLVPKLINKKSVYGTCMEFSNIFGCSMQSVLVAGQIEKLAPLIFRYAKQSGYVMERNLTNVKLSYEGGYVHASQLGFIRDASMKDFAGLYPTAQIGYNLSMDTMIPLSMPLDEVNKIPHELIELKFKIAKQAAADEPEEPDEIEEPEEVMNPVKSSVLQNIMAGGIEMEERTLKVAFVKSSVRRGLLCGLLEELRAEREKVKVAMKQKKGDEYDDYDRKQNAIKCAANSIYGILGAVSDISCSYVGAAVTAIGQRTIKAAMQYATDHWDAKHVYTDTDSIFFVTPMLKCALSPELMDNVRRAFESGETEYSTKTASVADRDAIAKLITEEKARAKELDDAGLYPKPMTIEFEGYCIAGLWLSKKFYIAVVIKSNGDISLKSRGVLTRRSDYCNMVKRLYSEVCFAILFGGGLKQALSCIKATLSRLFNDELNFDEMSKSSKYAGAGGYVSNSAPMAVLAHNAKAYGEDLSESRVLFVYAYVGSYDPLLPVSQKMMTRHMFETSGAQFDRMHYALHVIANPIEKLLVCAFPKFAKLHPCGLDGSHLIRSVIEFKGGVSNKVLSLLDGEFNMS